MSDLQASYQKAIRFAAEKHAIQNQLIPGTNIPYVVHLSNVAMEILMAAQATENFDVTIAVQIALLHDVLEDTATTFEEIEVTFGNQIAQAVQALSKNDAIPAVDKMADSLLRIKALPKEVWAVKMADRITNLQPPPQHWTIGKINTYKEQALLIATELKDGNAYLANRLAEQIVTYSKYSQADIQP